MAAIVLFCLALLVCIVLGTNILYALLAGLVIFTLYGKKQGFSWKELGKMICSGVKTSASVLLVFPLIGILTAFWRACGTLPFIICCAVDLIRPEILLLMTFLLNCGVSMLTGTAFGTAATMGTICVSVGISMGMDPVLLGGAMLNGGGIISMVRVALIVMISSAYSGIFRKTGLLDGLCGRVTALRDKTSPYASMLLTAVLASLLACNQTLTIILTNQLCAPSQKDKEEFAINLENSAVVVAPLIPWSIAGATPLSTVGAPMTGMAFACFLYILPLCELVRRTAQQRAAKKTAAQK